MIEKTKAGQGTFRHLSKFWSKKSASIKFYKKNCTPFQKYDPVIYKSLQNQLCDIKKPMITRPHLKAKGIFRLLAAAKQQNLQENDFARLWYHLKLGKTGGLVSLSSRTSSIVASSFLKPRLCCDHLHHAARDATCLVVLAFCHVCLSILL